MEWNSSEIEKLKEIYPYNTNSEISRILNRSIGSIVSRSNRLGLKKDKSHISKMISNRNKLVGRDLNYESLKSIALMYNSRSEFQKMDNSAYVTSRLNGYLDSICAHMSCFNFSVPQIMLKILIQRLISNNILYNDRKVIGPYEIDIFLPDINIAFEYDGKKWHSSNKNDKIKELMMIDKNIKLFRFKENSRKYEEDIKMQFKKYLLQINKITNKNISNSDVDGVDLSIAYSHIISEDKIQNICLKYLFLLKSKELDIYTSHMKKRSRWNDENAILEIRKSKTLNSLIKNSYGCYLWIKKNKKEYLLNNLLK